MNDNSVELMGYYGGDLEHCLSAWTSTNRDLSEDKRSRMPALLNMLAKEGHHTPFEKSSLHFLVKTEIASHIHILKHRIGVSVNGESARYKELKEDKLYIPHDWPEEMKAEYLAHAKTCYEKYHSTVKTLVDLGFSKKRAKESARFYLPYGNQIYADVMFNFRSFMHFQKLRNDPEHAQLEICEIAQTMLEQVRQTGAFPLSLAAFGY